MRFVCVRVCRAVKPTNVYLHNNGGHIVLGDFCLPSVLADLKTHNRPVLGISYVFLNANDVLLHMVDKSKVRLYYSAL